MSARGAREVPHPRSAPRPAAPRSRRPARNTTCGVQPVQQHARRRQVVDRLGHEGFAPSAAAILEADAPASGSTGEIRCSIRMTIQTSVTQLLLFLHGTTRPQHVTSKAVETAAMVFGSTASRRRRRRFALNSWLVDAAPGIYSAEVTQPRSMSSSTNRWLLFGDPMLAATRSNTTRSRRNSQTLGFLLPAWQPPDPPK